MAGAQSVKTCVHQFAANIEEAAGSHQRQDNIAVCGKTWFAATLDIELSDSTEQLAFAEGRRLHIRKVARRGTGPQRTIVTTCGLTIQGQKSLLLHGSGKFLKTDELWRPLNLLSS